MFSHQNRIAFPPDTPPQLLVVIDTEEEFDYPVAGRASYCPPRLLAVWSVS